MLFNKTLQFSSYSFCAFLFKFILKYFIILVTIVSGIFSFFYIQKLTVNIEEKSNSLLFLVGFLLEVLKCFEICSCINKNSCISSTVHVSNELAETSKRILSSHSDYWQICLISDFRWNCCRILLFRIIFLTYGLYYVFLFLNYLEFLRFASVLSNALSTYVTSCSFCPLVFWCVNTLWLIDFLILIHL